MKTFSSKLICRVLVLCMIAAPYAAPTQAALIGTEQATAQAQRDKVRSFLSRAEVGQQLETLGVSPAAAGDRVAALSDDEVRELAGRIDALPAGAHGAELGFFPAVLIVLLFVLLLYMVDSKK
jgi:hypothetical protein